MDGTRYTVTLEEFRLFHGIDRALFVILVRDLGRNATECVYIMGLWLWLERAGFYNFVSKVLRLPPFLINELADEAVACLSCLHPQFTPPPEATEIPLTHSLGQRDISLLFFYENRLAAFEEIVDVVRGVCLPTLSDILENGPPGFVNNPIQPSIMGPVYVNQGWAPNSPTQRFTATRGKPRKYEMSKEEEDRSERTMFVTFSKGYPVSEEEVTRYFVRIFGNCIESFHMQEVRRNEQALYARIVFHSPSFIHSILNGLLKAKFNINGKHVWMRQFVPKPRYQPQY